MKALSVKQPWAELIASGSKTIETRTWETKYRGPLLICASKQPDRRGVFKDAISNRLFGELLYGMAVAVVDLVDCRPMTEDDCEAALCERAPFAWVLENVRRIEPFPVKGRLRLFEVAFEE